MGPGFRECGGKWSPELGGGGPNGRLPIRGADAGRIKNLLIIFSGGIGDMIVFIPALESLGHFFSAGRITVMTSTPEDQVLRDHPRVAAVLAPEKIPPPAFFRRFDLVLNFGPNPALDRILRLANVPLLAAKSRFFDDPQPIHASEYHRNLAAGITASFFKPLFHPSPAERRAARQFMDRRRLQPGRELIIAVHPGSSHPRKHWPWRRFAALCRRLNDEYEARVLLLSGPSERGAVRDIAARAEGRPIVVRRPLGVVAALLTECALLIANDSGMMHLGAAVGVPVVGLFGGKRARPEVWGPLARDQVIIRRDTMSAITIDEVMKAVNSLL